MLAEFLPAQIWAFLITFARVGTLMMIMPVIGERYVSMRVRLMLALGMSLLILPIVAPSLPDLPAMPLEVFVLMGNEIVTGLFIGGGVRFLFAALHFAGTVAGFQSGLGFVNLVDPGQGTQGALLSTFYTLIGTAMILATDMHHLLLYAVRDSYALFLPGQFVPVGDFAEIVTELSANVISLGFQISTPFVISGLTIYFVMGILARLMPQFQVFFVILPLQILLSMFVFVATVGAVMLWFLQNVEMEIGQFLVF